MADDTENMNLPDLANPDQDISAQASGSKGNMAMDDGDVERNASDLEAVFDIPVNVSAILGKSHIEVSELLKLDEGSIIELDRKVGEAIDIYVNDRLVARGEVVVVEERLGVTMTEIIKSGIN